MAQVNPLDIDLENLKFDFSGEWLRFQESRPQKFLGLYLSRELRDIQSKLETASGEEVLRLQGQALIARRFATILQQNNVEDTVKSVIEHYGRHPST
jgi:hypothetical protein